MFYNSTHNTGARNKPDILGDAPAVKSHFVARNTVEWFAADGTRHVRLHDTDILTFHPDGSISVYTGGFNTITTRERLNRFLPVPFHVWTDKGVLNLGRGNWFDGHNGTVQIRERAEIGSRGAIRSDTGKGNRKVTADRRLIDGFMRKFRALETLPMPDGGDPWVSVDPVSGKYGESEVRLWLRERYIFGSLIVAAGRFAGLTDTGVGYTMFGKPDAFKARRVRRYLRVCLGYCA